MTIRKEFERRMPAGSASRRVIHNGVSEGQLQTQVDDSCRWADRTFRDSFSDWEARRSLATRHASTAINCFRDRRFYNLGHTGNDFA